MITIVAKVDILFHSDTYYMVAVAGTGSVVQLPIKSTVDDGGHG